MCVFSSGMNQGCGQVRDACRPPLTLSPSTEHVCSRNNCQGRMINTARCALSRRGVSIVALRKSPPRLLLMPPFALFESPRSNPTSRTPPLLCPVGPPSALYVVWWHCGGENVRVCALSSPKYFVRPIHSATHDVRSLLNGRSRSVGIRPLSWSTTNYFEVTITVHAVLVRAQCCVCFDPITNAAEHEESPRAPARLRRRNGSKPPRISISPSSSRMCHKISTA